MNAETAERIVKLKPTVSHLNGVQSKFVCCLDQTTTAVCNGFRLGPQPKRMAHRKPLPGRCITVTSDLAQMKHILRSCRDP